MSTQFPTQNFQVFQGQFQQNSLRFFIYIQSLFLQIFFYRYLVKIQKEDHLKNSHRQAEKFPEFSRFFRLLDTLGESITRENILDWVAVPCRLWTVSLQLFFLYRSPSSSSCSVVEAVSSNIDKVLILQPSANIMVW